MIQHNTQAAKVIVLGAGRPHRGDDPSALVFTSANKRVLDWVIDAFSSVELSEIHFVGGFRLEELKKEKKYAL